MSDKHRSTAIAIPGYRAGTWKADPEHSTVAFSLRQMGFKVHGRFTKFDIVVVTGDDPLKSSVGATIDLASIDTGNPKRDEHIRSAAFLDAAKYPAVTYDSTGVRRSGNGWIVDGRLKMHDRTRAVPLVISAAAFTSEAAGGCRADFSAAALVDRSEFGIDQWSSGGLVSAKVHVDLRISARIQS